MLHSDTPQEKYFSQLVSLNPSSLSKYELSFKLKTKGLKKSSTGFVWINLLDADTAMVLETGWGNYQGTHKWETYSYVFFVPSNVTDIKIGGTIRGKGTLWFDDFKLQKVALKSEDINLSSSADHYIKTVVDTMRTNALNRERLNFDDIHQMIRLNANGADKPEDTYAAIQKSTPYLVDRHSHFFTPAELKQMFGDVAIEEVINDDSYIQKQNLNVDSLKSTINFSSGKLLDDQIGYLSIASFTNLYLEAVRMYADSMQQLIEQFDQGELKGWVIDLRKNVGGATPPMIAGIGPLLQESNKAYYTDAMHKPVSEFYYQDGCYYAHKVGEPDTIPLLKSQINYKLKDDTLPIAVLIGPGSASAAEGVATLLAGEPNVKMFGEKTAGLTTGNKFFVLSDNAVLNLTTGYLANRHRVVYERGIAPNIHIEADDNQGSTEDIVQQGALEWINGQ